MLRKLQLLGGKIPHEEINQFSPYSELSAINANGEVIASFHKFLI